MTLKEAEILCYIDNIDARMNMFEKAYKNLEAVSLQIKYLVLKIVDSTILNHSIRIKRYRTDEYTET